MCSFFCPTRALTGAPVIVSDGAGQFNVGLARAVASTVPELLIIA